MASQAHLVRLVDSPLAGIALYPQIMTKAAVFDEAKFTWYRRLLASEDSPDSEGGSWEYVGCDKTYTPAVVDIGYTIQVKLTPKRPAFTSDGSKSNLHMEMMPIMTTTKGVVLEGPESCIFDNRVSLTKEHCRGESFRVVSYNILADFYASTELYRDDLFPYCPEHALEIGYRQQLIAKELSGYNADIVCLQEVDRAVFELQLMSSMSCEGYGGVFQAKDGMEEGVAIFYRKEKFRLVNVEYVVLRKALKEKRNENLYLKVCKSEQFKNNLLSRETCLLVGLLQSITDTRKYVLVGNTHLYWHPRGGQLRLLQTEIAASELRRLYTEYAQSDGSRILSCIFTGDFNSDPYSGAVQLLTKGYIPSNHADWYSLGKAEHIPGVELHNSMKFESACGYPEYTNFVTGFAGCLDYIFIDPRFLQVDRVIPQPTHDDVVQFTALPNEAAPSDHIAQVVDLSWV